MSFQSPLFTWEGMALTPNHGVPEGHGWGLKDRQVAAAPFSFMHLHLPRDKKCSDEKVVKGSAREFLTRQGGKGKGSTNLGPFCLKLLIAGPWYSE